jgi:tetratricopeptide (TPR) repeat protein
MKNKYFKILTLIIILNIYNINLNAKNNFLEEGKILFEKKNYKNAKFLFEREIVFNPKNEKAYLYLAKIFNKKKNTALEEINLDTVLLLDPKNEEAIYYLILLEINKSNFSEARNLILTFNSVCKNMCIYKKELDNKLKNSLK